MQVFVLTPIWYVYLIGLNKMHCIKYVSNLVASDVWRRYGVIILTESAILVVGTKEL